MRQVCPRPLLCVSCHIGDLPGGELHRQLIDRLLLAGMSSAASFKKLMPLMDGSGPTEVIEGLRRQVRITETALRTEALLADQRAPAMTCRRIHM